MIGVADEQSVCTVPLAEQSTFPSHSANSVVEHIDVLGLHVEYSPHLRVGRVRYRELVLVTILSVPLPSVQLLWMMLCPFSGGSHADLASP